MLRRGISLLEVMFAIGVIAVGLLGVLAVVPVALSRVGKGQVADQSTRIAVSAMREFDVRNMGEPNRWLRLTNINSNNNQRRFDVVTWARGDDGDWGAPGDDDGDGHPTQQDPRIDVDEAGWRNNQGFPLDTRSSFPIPRISYCLDPLFLSRPWNWGATTITGNITADPIGFPYINTTQAPAPLKMQRMTLARSVVSPHPVDRPPATQFAFQPMTAAQAEQIFVTDDDLVFVIPEEAEDPPKPAFIWTRGADGDWGNSGVNDDQANAADDIDEQGWVGSDDVTVIRETEGNYSWMATIVPNRDELDESHDRYLLSVVVFHRRDPRYQMNLFSERLAYIPWDGFWSGGTTGGDVTIHAHPDFNSEQMLDMKQGDWVMLCGPLIHATYGTFNYFRWYRVAALDPDARVDTYRNRQEWQREVTLEGPDWPVTGMVLMPDPNQSGNPPPLVPSDTRVVIVPNVVAVYERPLIMEAR